ncbi:hypothetical protein VNO77_43177 [Canavalia gladiata]|uniref:Uncharacterized protein n=1 Tax=Canavalia gladiata TaxID=3824 RepID=A0AAN9JTR1_CANGL
MEKNKPEDWAVGPPTCEGSAVRIPARGTSHLPQHRIVMGHMLLSTLLQQSQTVTVAVETKRPPSLNSEFTSEAAGSYFAEASKFNAVQTNIPIVNYRM